MGGSGSSTSSQIDVDQSALAQFIATTTEGQQYKGQFNPNAFYYQIGSSTQSYVPPSGAQGFNPNQMNGQQIVGPDVTGMIAAFQQWQSQQSNQSTLWNEYSQLAQQMPGRDQTILTGPQSPIGTALTNPSAARTFNR